MDVEIPKRKQKWKSNLDFSRTHCAIEVKNAPKVQAKMLKGLLSFKEDYPEAETCLLYRGKERLKIKSILCQPLEDFLKNLQPESPIQI